MTKKEILQTFADINFAYNNCPNCGAKMQEDPV